RRRGCSKKPEAWQSPICFETSARVASSMQHSPTVCSVPWRLSKTSLTAADRSANGNNGIAGNMSSKITGSVALANGNRGIVTASRSIVTGNIANENGIGINMNSEGVVSGNTASFNKFDGITCADDCTLTGNTVVGNGFGGSLPIGRGIVTNSRSTLIG